MSIIRISLVTLALASTAFADTESPVPWSQPSGRGVAIGAENGLWGSRMGTGLRVRIPIGDHFSADVRPLVVSGIGTMPYRMDVLARLELHGATSPIMNAFRVYGGGGVYGGVTVTGVTMRKALIGVGGHVGLEAFIGPAMSFYFEIGANGGNDDFFAGGTAMGGVLFYL